MKKKLITLPKLKKKAWKLISIHVRKEGADFAGYTTCFTCTKVDLWKNFDCGHYLHGKLDFDLRNLKKQCTRCNHFLRGNLGTYAKNLVITYGIDWVEQLERDAQKKGNYYTRQELAEIIQKYGT